MAQRTDRLFAVLMALQWLAEIAVAWWVAPRAWTGATDPHVWSAIACGGVIAATSIVLALARPGRATTRHAIAVGQMLSSALLIHLSGGRIETHFHIFGSLALLAFYRDWTVLVPATAVVAGDHLLRGAYWPESVYGVAIVGPWRWLEYTGWVLFEDAFLLTSCVRGTREMWKTAERQAALEAANACVEDRVVERTAQLAASEGRFRSLSACAPLGIFQTDADGRVTYVNDRWRELTDVHGDGDLWQRWQASLVREDRERAFARWTSQLHADGDAQTECRVRTTTGDERHLHCRGRALRGADGRLLGTVGMIEDVTERIRLDRLQTGQHRALEIIATGGTLEQALAELTRVMEAQAPGSINSVLIVDATTGTLRHGAAPGLPAEYCDAIDGVAIGPAVGSCGTAAHSGRRVIVTDIANDPLWADFAGLALRFGLRACWSEPVLSSTGAVIGTFATYYDHRRGPTPDEIRAVAVATRIAGIAIERSRIESERAESMRQLERARAHAEAQAVRLREQAVELVHARDEALASARAKSAFLATMSHEIRTPMNGVIGMADMLMSTALDAEQRDYAETIRGCADALLVIINDVLDFSKIDAGKMTIESVDFDLRDVVEEVAELLSPRAAEKRVELLCVLPPAFPACVAGDPVRLRQVLTNLAGNAVKFTEAGEVAIEVRAVATSASHVTVRLSVRDTGIGIPAEQCQQIFHAFTQADGSTTRRYGGTGLGLAISRQLVELMGGRIGVESAVGVGTSFWVELTLPVRVSAVDDSRCLDDLRVLLIDPNASARAALCERLRGWGARVDAAGDVRDALARLHGDATDPIALVVCDAAVGAVERIRADATLRDRPIVLLSTVAQRAGESRRGLDDLTVVVAKPVRRAPLLRALTGLLGTIGPATCAAA